MAASVQFKNITKQFGDTCAVDNLSLSIEPGELFFLLGPSGCGKTALLRCLAGFAEPDEGRILLDGRDITRVPPHQRDTGMVFQSYALWPHMTVRQNVAFGLEIRKMSAGNIRERTDDALQMTRMADRADHKPNQLSGGQQQRVALARALVVHPKCLLLDEPLSNLDAKLRLEMRSEIRRICKAAGLTAIYVTHDQKEALSISDRLAVMHEGHIEQVGPPRDVYAKPCNRFVAGFIGETNFIEGTVRRVEGETLHVETRLGPLASRTFPPETTSGDAVTVSIRPEALRFDTAPDEAPNMFVGSVHDTIYLGEVAQHRVGMPECATRGRTVDLKGFELNPRIVARENSEPAEIWIDPRDVVVLKA